MSDKKELTLDDLASQLEALREENKAKNEQLLAQAEQLEAKNNQLAEQNEQLSGMLQVNQKLAEKLSGLSQGSITLEDTIKRPKLPADATFTVGSGKSAQKYELLAPVMHIPGIGHLTAEEVLMDPKAQKMLVELKSGLIKDVV